MDRTATLNLLDTMIESSGAVVLFNDSHPEVPENSWHSSFNKVEDLPQLSALRIERSHSRARRGNAWVTKRMTWRAKSKN
jgi:hypothetical protein